MMFRNRLDAARQLARRLEAWHGQHPLVLAIPRGAVPMGRVIARHLDGDLDVVLVRKLRAQQMEEVAIGAVDESGWTWLAPSSAWLRVDEAWLQQEKQLQMQVLRSRRSLYTPVRPPLDPRGRLVIVVDDGLATGATMVAALHAVRTRAPRRLVCAVPVAAPEALALVRPLADECLCLHAPEHFQAVGQFYASFAAVEDADVVRMLRGHARHRQR